MYKRNYVIVITGTEDIIAIIAEVTRYNFYFLPTDSRATSVQQNY